MRRDVIAGFGDTHIISTVGLCPAEVEIDDGGVYKASKGQTWLLESWQDYWQKVRAVKPRGGGQRYAIHFGDVIDGNHHGTSQLITTNESIMIDTACGLLEPVRQWADHMFITRGTDVHAGEAGRWEESIARRLKTTEDPLLGTASWWHLALTVQGVLLDCAHHPITSTGRAWLSGGVAGVVAADARLEYATSGDKPPDLVLRGHNHRISDSGATFAGTRALCLPAWQLGSGFANKKHAGKLAHIGGALIIIEDGSYTVQLLTYQPTRRTPWKAT